MKLGIFSDVHSNLEALNAVLGRLEELGATEYLCCGDIVGYGPDPAACIRRMRQLPLTAVAGNHDSGVLGLTPISFFNAVAREAIHRTIGRLVEDEIGYLRSLPLTAERAGFRLVHGSPSAPGEWRYVLSARAAEEELAYFSEATCIIGHSHRPLVVRRGPGGPARAMRRQEFDLEPGTKYVVNAGSVGQPRDGDARACCLLFDSDTGAMTFHRVSYDVGAVQRKMRAAGLPEFLAARLADGR